ncbi:hypothetical protein, partial [Phytoactinopolyspora endophytica]|uniref:hypothetical protein n=1 Tax=Phytoactinopolyspora endophytica TaxID=1642495 RepID=UPI00197BCC08
AEVPLAEVLGGTRRPLRTAAVVHTTGARGSMRRQLERATDVPAVKLTGVVGADALLDAAVVAAELTGVRIPIWLQPWAGTGSFRGEERLDPVKLAAALADRMASGELPRHVVLQLPAGAENLDELLEAQAAVGAPGDGADPGLVVMADVGSATDAVRAADRGLAAVNLDPQRLGGPLGVLDLARELPDRMRLALSTVSHVSDVGARAFAELAAAVSDIDYCALAGRRRPGHVVIEPALS